jgi:integrase/recombinase XerD
LLIRLLFDTGMRRGELAQVTIGEHGTPDRVDHSIRVPAFKSSDTRTVTYTPEYVGLMLDQWLDNGYRDAVPGASDSDYLFPKQSRDRISGKRINVIVKNGAENAGLEHVKSETVDGRERHGVTAHTLRHTHAVTTIKSGIDVRRLMEMMGHSDLDVTLDYLRIVEKEYVKESRKFDPFGSDSE